MYIGLASALFVAIQLSILAAASDDEKAFNAALQAGDALLIQGRQHYQDAASKYTAAISIRPNDMKAVFRRAELYSLMKDHAKCESDIDQVLSADPDHRQALTMKASLSAMHGNFIVAARIQEQLSGIWAASGNKKKADTARNAAIKFQTVGSSWTSMKEELSALPAHPRTYDELKHRMSVHQRCVNVLRDVISHAKDSVELRLRRIECSIIGRDQMSANEDLKYILVRDPDNLEAVALNARALRLLGSIDQARREIRRCLSLDPEYTNCAKLHKGIKKYETLTSKIKEAVDNKKWDAVIKGVEDSQDMEADPPNTDLLMRWKCEAYTGNRDITKGLAACTELLDMEDGDKNPAMASFLVFRAELYLMDDDIDKAEADVRKANELNNNHEGVRDLQRRIENIRKGNSRKDYYKILGIKKSATEKEIRKAYRNIARHHHPDHYPKDITPEEKERKDREFRDINEAKEMLMDEEKRRRYDSGEDVANPQAQHQQQHHGFQGFPGGFPGGGGGGFHFRFG